MEKLLNIHPGEILLEDVLKPLNMSVNQFARSLAVDATRLNEIVRGTGQIVRVIYLEFFQTALSPPQISFAGQAQHLHQLSVPIRSPGSR